MPWRTFEILDHLPAPIHLRRVAFAMKCKINACPEVATQYIEETNQELCAGHAMLAYLLWETCKRGMPSDPVDAGNQWAIKHHVPYRIPEGDRDSLKNYLKEARKMAEEL